jgi:hypothetical protein
MTPTNAREVAVAHRSKNPPPPTGGEHAFLDGLVLQLLQKSPELRYQSGKFNLLRSLIS